MPSFDRREVAYTEARAELMRRIEEDFITDLDEHDRGEEIAGIVRELQDRFPDLDEQMTRKLMGEGMRRQAD